MAFAAGNRAITFTAPQHPPAGADRSLHPPTPAEPRHDRLATLLTPVRAQMLRSLGAPASMTSIAARFFLSPSSATYQVQALIAAGLVVRRRDGAYTMISRSALGEGLIRLYDGVGAE